MLFNFARYQPQAPRRCYSVPRKKRSKPPPARIIARVYRLLLHCSDYARIAKCSRGETQTGTMP
jgi:hypothetical protein